MKVTKMNHVYQLAFMPTVFPVNCYLVEELDSLTLIDAALPSSYKKIMKVAEDIGKPIKQIVLTHAHSDHIGSLDALKEKLPNVTVSISTRDAILLTGDKRLLKGEPDTPIRGGVPKTIQTKPDRTLQDGDVIGSLKVLETPGHTPGSISLIDTRTNSIIVGDAFQVRGGVAVSGSLKWLFPAPAMATWSKEVALQSAKIIKAMNPTLLAAGHGKMITSPASLLQQAIEEAERKNVV
ncbi:MBL fold metallo-hydrolase [Alkalicoccobacillus murimartini]|uniref:Glyoxylase-like metal-dependent hydrolase (Beta-lactamase superfamily II) n=1 Tax=Alkalicoccobacillus murimartini TaxID=171685 RepID=A0ABT9YIH6_9BACI|nr:MBL fold metallo-hydrolase [Alkalicoccobacillus murimartini]MDQ0207665.1 glyoxylase-like metal-dependent hydrolase (beta-lactamase superfamily II) [Alkalicoccobacillus murimartini]